MVAIPGLSTVVNFGAGGVPAGGTQGGDSDDHGDRDDGGGRDGDDDDGGHDGRGDRDDDAEPAPAPGMTTVQTNHANTAGAGAPPGPWARRLSRSQKQPGTIRSLLSSPRRRRCYFAPTGGDVAPAATSPAVPAATPRRIPPEVAASSNPFAPISRSHARANARLRRRRPHPGRLGCVRICPRRDNRTHPGARRRNRRRRARWARVCRPKLAARRLRRQPELRSRPAGPHFVPNVATASSGSISDGPGGGSTIAYLTALGIAAGAGLLRPVTQASTRAPPSVAHSPPVPPG